MTTEHDEIKKVFLAIPGYVDVRNHRSINGRHLFHFKASEDALKAVAKIAAWSNSRLSLYLGGDDEIIYLLDFDADRLK